MQLLRVENTDSVYTIHHVTEKAILLECDNGRWVSNSGFTGLWVPKSILDYLRYDGRKDVSQHGMHVVNLPDWFINKNSKIL